MKKNNDGQDKKSSRLPKKWADKLPTDFEEKAEGFSDDELKKRLVDYEKAISATENDMTNDAALETAKEELKGLTDPYKDIIKTNQAMIRCIIKILEERGTI